MEQALIAVAGALVLALLAGAPFWLADRRAEAQGLAAWLAGVQGRPEEEFPAAFGRAFDHLFGKSPGRLGFIVRSVVVSLLTAAVAISLVMLLNGPFLRSVLDDEYQRGAVFGRFLSTVMLVNLGVGYICLVYCRDVAAQMARGWSWRRVPWFLAKDVAVKAVVLLVAMLFVFTSVSPNGTGSGRMDSVLLSVPEGLWHGLLFENLSAVYVYSAFVSSLWLWGYVGAALVLARLRPVRAVLPVGRRPMLSIAVLLGAGAAVAYGLLVGLAAAS
ncbi:hypothetical protein [Caenispirillum bisanense]|uniref:Uncharacterized protein n=1 Tax=Caenispirillum bisanense TaxID=414052 RepID=A0A286H1M3_9PROT|nr:hypothetical protein [Caenispirillum bisanense]SOE01673.1 hypothetical protein SAMN05421508_12122 [Caenispirillum bisanense]